MRSCMPIVLLRQLETVHPAPSFYKIGQGLPRVDTLQYLDATAVLVTSIALEAWTDLNAESHQEHLRLPNIETCHSQTVFTT